MSAPDYEIYGPSKEKVKTDMMKHFEDSNVVSESVIDICIERYIEKNKGFGSYRGYYCFSKGDLIEMIEDYEPDTPEPGTEPGPLCEPEPEPKS